MIEGTQLGSYCLRRDHRWYAESLLQALCEQLDLFSCTCLTMQITDVYTSNRMLHKVVLTINYLCHIPCSFATTDVHFHALKQCLAHGVDLVTPSYPCPQFLKLGKEAAARGITVICEQGCDPGIDHMLAMEYIDRVHAQGGKVREKSALEGIQLSPFIYSL